jgi:pyruvate carboxylase subunit A
MISKLCTWGRNRDEALVRMKRALFEYVVVGVKTNIPFHRAVMSHEAFVKGDLTTHFIEEHNILEEVARKADSDARECASLAMALEERNKKIAAISVAVGSYLNAAKSHDMKGSNK